MLLSEHLIDGVTEISPPDVAALLGSLEVLHELLELIAREDNLGHVKADAELGLGDEAGAELIEVTEELRHSGALLLAEETDASEDVFDIIRSELDDLSLDLAWLSARVIVE